MSGLHTKLANQNLLFFIIRFSQNLKEIKTIFTSNIPLLSVKLSTKIWNCAWPKLFDFFLWVQLKGNLVIGQNVESNVYWLHWKLRTHESDRSLFQHERKAIGLMYHFLNGDKFKPPSIRYICVSWKYVFFFLLIHAFHDASSCVFIF